GQPPATDVSGPPHAAPPWARPPRLACFGPPSRPPPPSSLLGKCMPASFPASLTAQKDAVHTVHNKSVIIATRTAAVGAKRKQAPADSGSGRTELAWAAFAAIQPIVAVLIELGITSPEAESLLRSFFVHEASTWLTGQSGGGKPSDSRVALVTGLHRNVIREIRAEPPQIAPKRAGRGYRAGRLLEAWHTDPAYKDAHGNPMDLPERGAAPSL